MSVFLVLQKGWEKDGLNLQVVWQCHLEKPVLLCLLVMLRSVH